MRRRFLILMAVATIWGPAAVGAGLTLGWTLLAAAVIGILATIGCEPPARRRIRRAVIAVARARS